MAKILLSVFFFSFLFLYAFALDVTILHTNDVHSRFEQADMYGGECTEELEIAGQCYGGVARRMTKIKVSGCYFIQ